MSTRSSSPGLSDGEPTSLGPQQLIQKCIEFYLSYNPAQVTLDTHTDNCISKGKITHQDDEIFIRQVLYGVFRYQKLLRSFLDSFYHHNSSVASRVDSNLIMMYCYLALFRLEELTFPQYRRLVEEQDPQKMVVFLRYLYDEAKLKEVCRDDWLKVYDKQYVDDLIDGLLSWRPQMDKLIAALEGVVYLTKQEEDVKEVTKRGPTVPEPFNITAQKPKPPPIEEALPPPVRAKPPPKFSDGPTREQRAIEAARAENRKLLEAKYSNPATQPFRLATLERPTNTERIRAEVEEERGREYTWAPAPAKELPPAPTAQVKLNAAAILREDALYRKKQAEEAGALKRYESELRDASQFNEWQSLRLAEDAAARAAEMEARRLEMAATQEAAIKARMDKVEENLELGRQQKEAGKKLEEELRREREEVMKVNQQKREAVILDRVQVEQAKEKLAMEKKQQAEEVRRREEEAARVRAEQAAREMSEKKDIILQLRALEKAPKQRAKVLDPTKVTDHGLFEDMSLVELQERLDVAKRRKIEEEERTRQKILQQKQEKEQSLMDKVANIQRVRKMQQTQAQVRKQSAVQQKAAVEESTRVRHESDVLQLHSKLEAKHAAVAAEKARLAAEEKKIKFEQMQQAAGAAVVEENKFRELREGAKREIVDRQSGKLRSAGVYEETKKKAQTVRTTNMKQQLRGKKDFLRAYDEKVKQLTSEHQTGQEEDLKGRRQVAGSQRQFEASQRAQHASAAYRPFSGTKTAMTEKLKALGQGIEI